MIGSLLWIGIHGIGRVRFIGVSLHRKHVNELSIPAFSFTSIASVSS